MVPFLLVLLLSCQINASKMSRDDFFDTLFSASLSYLENLDQDSQLCSKVGLAFVRNLQGTLLKEPDVVMNEVWVDSAVKAKEAYHVGIKGENGNIILQHSNTLIYFYCMPIYYIKIQTSNFNVILIKNKKLHNVYKNNCFLYALAISRVSPFCYT